MTNEQKKERVAALIAELQSLLAENRTEPEPEPKNCSRFYKAVRACRGLKTDSDRIRAEELLIESERLFKEMTGLDDDRVWVGLFDYEQHIGVMFKTFQRIGNRDGISFRFDKNTTPDHIRSFIEENLDLLTKPGHGE